MDASLGTQEAGKMAGSVLLESFSPQAQATLSLALDGMTMAMGTPASDMSKMVTSAP